jgi:2-iminobutanoate/2-iminopropanoate deaminase
MSTREAIGVDKVEPYSKIIKAGGFIFIKSHVGYDKESGEYPADIEEQTANTLGHLERALESAGGTAADIVKVSVYLSDIDRDFDGMGVAYRAWFDERGVTEQPARTTIGVPLSWPQLLIQMDLIAVA